MAIMRAQTTPLSRSSGRTAPAAAAYRAGARVRHLPGAVTDILSVEDAAAGRPVATHDYSQKSGVAHSEIVLPSGTSTASLTDRSRLWSAAEAAETRSDARTAREWQLALPNELDAEDRLELARSFARLLTDRYRVACDVAIHEPSATGDQRNHHAHILCTTRSVSATGFGAKVDIERSDRALALDGLPAAREQIVQLREAWSRLVNIALARAKIDARIDHRSYQERGLDIVVPRSVHVGRVHAEARDVRTGGERIKPVVRLSDEARALNERVLRDERALRLLIGSRLHSRTDDEGTDAFDLAAAPQRNMRRLARYVGSDNADILRRRSAAKRRPEPQYHADRKNQISTALDQARNRVDAAAVGIAARSAARGALVREIKAILIDLPVIVTKRVNEIVRDRSRPTPFRIERIADELQELLSADQLPAARATLQRALDRANEHPELRAKPGHDLGPLLQAIEAVVEALEEAMIDYDPVIVRRQGLRLSDPAGRASFCEQEAPVSPDRRDGFDRTQAIGI